MAVNPFIERDESTLCERGAVGFKTATDCRIYCSLNLWLSPPFAERPPYNTNIYRVIISELRAQSLRILCDSTDGGCYHIGQRAQFSFNRD